MWASAQGRAASRSTGGATNQVRIGDQSQGRKGARSRRAANAARYRRRGDRMRRREFITLLGGAAAWPLAAQAQKIPRIGVLLVNSPEPLGPFRESLRELGYVEGKTIQFEFLSAEDQMTRLPELAVALVNSKVDVMVAVLTPAVSAAKNATRDIPIVMGPAGDPLATGLVASLARPGGNLTGVSATGAETGAKNLELIRDAFPSVTRVAVLAHATDPFTRGFVEGLERGAQLLRKRLQSIDRLCRYLRDTFPSTPELGQAG